MTTHTISSRLAFAITTLAVAFACATVVLFAPTYLFVRGFPLDDAWIHLVYGRSVARDFSLAYNPGIPATGATSPLWAAVLAVPHRIFGSAPVLPTKLMGLALHGLAAFVLTRAAVDGGRARITTILGVVLTTIHPDLVASAASGMETALCEVAIALIAWSIAGPLEVDSSDSRGQATRGFLLSALFGAIAFLTRPELTLVALGVPLLSGGASRRRRVAAALVGSVAAFAALATRNLQVSGRPLPATFYAKAASATLEQRAAGFLRTEAVLDSIPLADASMLLLILFVVAAAKVLRGGAKRSQDSPASSPLERSLMIVGVVGACVACTLVLPVTPRTYYHQRYVLPFVACILFALPSILHETLRAVFGERWKAVAGVLAAMALISLGLATPARMWRLDNDAHNIDDVQVAFGRSLARMRPNHVVWVIDAGASRYFAGSFVVDLMGLNTPEILDRRRDAFLGAHPPRRIEIVPGWNRVDIENGPWPAMSFAATTQYTVSSFTEMARHTIIGCPRGGLGVLNVQGRWTHRFACPTSSAMRR